MTRVSPTMRAAVFMGLRDVAIEERPTPEVGPGEMLLEVSHCGICGSDLHFLMEWGGNVGAIEGHEDSGTAVAHGPGVEGWEVGVEDGGWMGAFAQYKKVSAAEAFRVPDGLSMKHAALAEPLAVALHGITQGGGARPGTRWLITGGGPIGFLSVAALKAMGVD